jgi:anti-anti-sigma factor
MNTELPAEFAVHAARMQGAYVVVPAGELDLGTVDEVRAVMQRRPPECDLLVLDLRGLSFFDTSGMRLVLEALHGARENGHRFAILRGCAEVQHLFALARVEDRLPFFDDLAQALKAT